MAAALSRVYAGLCRRDRLTSKECPFWLDSLFCGPGIHGTGSARKLAVVSKAHTLELERFSTCNNFHREVLRRNEVFVLTYFDRIIFRYTPPPPHPTHFQTPPTCKPHKMRSPTPSKFGHAQYILKYSCIPNANRQKRNILFLVSLSIVDYPLHSRWTTTSSRAV